MKKSLLFLGGLALSLSSIAQTPYFSEDFTAGIGGWTYTAATGSDGWNVGTATTLSSQYFPIPALAGNMIGTNDDACNCDKSADFLMSPPISLVGSNSPFLTFDSYHYAATYGGGTESADVQVSNDGGVTWTSISTLVGSTAGWTAEAYSLSAYAGDTIQLGFLYDDDGVWSYGWALDNIVIADLPAVEVEVTALQIPEYFPMSMNADVALVVSNKGGNPITSLDFKWSDGTNIYTDNVTGLNIPTYGSDTLIHSTSFNSSTSGQASVGAWVEISGDADTTNNFATGNLTVLSFATSPKVVIEEGTGTWCGWCPRGSVAMEYMENNFPDSFIGVAVHNNDPMVVTAYDNGAGITGFPGMNVDRTIMGTGVSTATMVGWHAERTSLYPVANVSITDQSLHSYSGEATVTVEAEFAADLAGDYRFAVVVVEDGVTGTGGAYAQANYYSGGGNGNLTGAGHDWHLEPDPVPASSMVYDHVGRKLIGGYAGMSGSVPATVTENQKVSYTFTSNLSAEVDDYANVSFVALLLDPQGRVVNADKEHASMILGLEENLDLNVSVYPNPTNGMANIKLEVPTGTDVQVEILDNLGRLVHSIPASKLPAGTHVNQLDLTNQPAGIYAVQITANGQTTTKKLVIQ